MLDESAISTELYDIEYDDTSDYKDFMTGDTIQFEKFLPNGDALCSGERSSYAFIIPAKKFKHLNKKIEKEQKKAEKEAEKQAKKEEKEKNKNKNKGKK